MTPRGMPASTKPMNSGTAEQLQKGVTMPRLAAMTLPVTSRRPRSRARVRSGLKNERTTPMPKTTMASRSSTLTVS